MEVLVALALFALALAGPVGLERWARRSRAGAVLLILTTVATGVLAGIQFGKVGEIGKQRSACVVQGLSSEPGASQVLHIRPLPGYDGVQASIARKDGGKLRVSDVAAMRWTCPSAHLAPLPEDSRLEEEEIWLLDTGHRVLEEPVEVQLATSEGSWHYLDALEVRVRPNGCSQSDLTMLTYFHGVLGFLVGTWTLAGSILAIRWSLRRTGPG